MPETTIPSETARSSFLRVTCPDCGAKRILFSHADTRATCDVCGAHLATPTGGRLALRKEVESVEVLH